MKFKEALVGDKILVLARVPIVELETISENVVPQLFVLGEKFDEGSNLITVLHVE